MLDPGRLGLNHSTLGAVVSEDIYKIKIAYIFCFMPFLSTLESNFCDAFWVLDWPRKHGSGLTTHQAPTALKAEGTFRTPSVSGPLNPLKAANRR